MNTYHIVSYILPAADGHVVCLLGLLPPALAASGAGLTRPHQLVQVRKSRKFGGSVSIRLHMRNSDELELYNKWWYQAIIEVVPSAHIRPSLAARRHAQMHPCPGCGPRAPASPRLPVADSSPHAPRRWCRPNFHHRQQLST